MKKLLVVLLVSLGLQTQAQVSWCDSLSYTTAPQTTLIATGNSSLSPNMVDSIEWMWSACNTTLCYTAYGNPATFASILTTDTVKLCYDAYIYSMGATYVCTNCDSLVYDGNSYSWVLFNMGNPVNIEELGFVIEEDGVRWYSDQMYDLRGREITTAPKGTMYIKNRKLYLTK
tara:strand:- start:381 stop:899 length:519 start_codon:yes stop_codon:yes gene_type:complete